MSLLKEILNLRFRLVISPQECLLHLHGLEYIPSFQFSQVAVLRFSTEGDFCTHIFFLAFISLNGDNKDTYSIELFAIISLSIQQQVIE